MGKPQAVFTNAKRVTLTLTLALNLAGCTLFGDTRPPLSPAPPPAATRDARWQQDIAYLATELPRQHPDAFFHASRDDFRAAADALSAQVPQLDDPAIVVGLCQLAALLGDDHTAVEWPSGKPVSGQALPSPGSEQGDVSAVGPPVAGFGCYPLQLRCFSDGVYAVTTTAHGAVALGGRLLAIGGVPFDEAAARAASLTARTNDWMVLDRLPQLLTTPEVLQALGLGDGPRAATYLFARPPEPPGPPDRGPPPGMQTEADDEADDEGSDDEAPPAPEEPPSPTVELPLAAMRPGNLYDWRRLPEQLPLSEQRPKSAYWMEALPDRQAVFVQFNACREDDTLPFADFAREVFAALDRMPGGRLILDLRHNGGGNSAVIEPLLDGLTSRPALTGPALAVLIGRSTYSSAVMNALVLRQDFGALLLGEPTGGTLDGFGELQGFDLPNSRLHVHHSTRRFALVPGATSLAPDVSVPAMSADWFAGRDAVLDAALAGTR